MASKGAVLGAVVAVLLLVAAGSVEAAAVTCTISGGSPVLEVAVRAPGAVSAVRVYYRYEDGRDAFADMAPLGGRYAARLPRSPLGTGGLSYRIVAESTFTTGGGQPVQSTQLVAEAVGCGPTLRDPVSVAPAPVPAVPALSPVVPVLDEGPATPNVDKAPDLPPHPPTGGDPRSPPR
jgi:hypothetical protein